MSEPHQRHLHLVNPDGTEGDVLTPPSSPRGTPDDQLEFVLRESIRMIERRRKKDRKPKDRKPKRGTKRCKLR